MPDPVTLRTRRGEISVPHSVHARSRLSAGILINEVLTVISDLYHDRPVVVVHPVWENNLEQLYQHPLMERFHDLPLRVSTLCEESTVYIVRDRIWHDQWENPTGLSVPPSEARINHSMVPRNAAPIHAPPRSVAECVDQCVRTIRETYGEEPIALAHPDWRREWGRLGLYIESLVGRDLLQHVPLQFSDQLPRRQVWIIRASRLVEVQAPDCDHFAPQGRINLGILPIHSTPSAPPIDTSRATFWTVTQNGQYRARTPTHEEHSPEEQRLEKLLADRIAAGLVDG